MQDGWIGHRGRSATDHAIMVPKDVHGNVNVECMVVHLIVLEIAKKLYHAINTLVLVKLFFIVTISTVISTTKLTCTIELHLLPIFHLELNCSLNS